MSNPINDSFDGFTIDEFSDLTGSTYDSDDSKTSKTTPLPENVTDTVNDADISIIRTNPDLIKEYVGALNNYLVKKKSIEKYLLVSGVKHPEATISYINRNYTSKYLLDHGTPYQPEKYKWLHTTLKVFVIVVILVFLYLMAKSYYPGYIS